MVTTDKAQRLGSRMLGFVSAAALAGLCLFGAPTPTAHAAENCSFNWGIKESWRGYIQKKVFEGTWEKSSGVGFTGSKTGPDGAFVFTPKKATIDGTDSATIPMQGSLHFQSHKSKDGKFYLLDMKIYDIRVKASGSTAQIIADYDSYTWNGDMAATELGDPLKGDDEVLATIALKTPVNTDSGTVDLSGDATATAGTEKLFIADNYAAGKPMDPTSGVVKLDGSCAPSGDSSGSGSGSGGGSRVCGANFGRVNGEFTGANKEIMSMLSELNDTIGAVDLLMCNSNNLKNSVEEFTGVKNSSGGSGSKSSGSGGSGNGSGGSGSGSGSGSGGSDASTSDSSGSDSAGAASAGTDGGASTSDVCSATGAKGVQSATTSWGIKKSFQSYITGSIAKGKWTLSGIKHQNGQFVFPGNSGAVDPSAKKGTVGSNGGVKFLGHKGLLDLQIFNPEIQFNGNQGSLIANVRSSDMSGKKTNYGRVTVANLKFNSISVSDSQASGKASVFLTQAGSKAFAGFYEPGQELDPISFNAKLGASANCASGQGGAAASAAGGDSAADVKDSADAASDDADAASEDADSNTEGYENGKSKFKIKSSAATDSADKGVGGTGLDPSTYVLLAALALLLAGGSVGRLALSHPA